MTAQQCAVFVDILLEMVEEVAVEHSALYLSWQSLKITAAGDGVEYSHEEAEVKN